MYMQFLVKLSTALWLGLDIEIYIIIVTLRREKNTGHHENLKNRLI